MSRFIQLHVLTSYPPANLNRDDTGRPKTALMGDALRLRVSSQSLKRAWRTSDIFETALAGHIGTRTKRKGRDIFEKLRQAGVAEKAAREWARTIAGCFGKLKEAKSKKKADATEDASQSTASADAQWADLEIEQLAHFSPEEEAAIDALVQTCSARGSAPSDDELKLLMKPRTAADIAMFGRMLASSTAFNMEAAVQVAHAITVHRAAVEDDYFTAVDDLNDGREDVGAGHLGERGYGAGVFYLYLCINRELLVENLGGDAALANKALAALIEAVAKVSPTGMQNSFGSRAYASYMLAEKGDEQPRTLAQAFVKPVQPFGDKGMIELAVTALEKRREHFNSVYGDCASGGACSFNVEQGQGSLADLIQFVQA